MSATREEVDKAAPLVALRGQFDSSVHNLWTVYVVATFAAAGFGASGKLEIEVAEAVTVGYWLFALGHLALLRQTMRIAEALRIDLKAVRLPDTLIPNALRESGSNRNPMLNSTLIHLAIDVCVTVAIWVRFFP